MTARRTPVGRRGPRGVDRGLHGSTPWASSPDRLTQPLIRRDGQLVETDWESAMRRIVEVPKQLLTDKGPLRDRDSSTSLTLPVPTPPDSSPGSTPA